MQKLLIISFDALGDRELPRLLEMPHFKALAEKSCLHRGVDSVFPTNTYPVHASVATGLYPRDHGLLHNTESFPKRHAQWNYHHQDIKATTLWQAAGAKGLSVAAVMWPSTGGAPDIRWNIPELMALPGQNQILLNLRYGTKWLQIQEFVKHRRLLEGISQPARDRFATACMVDILTKHQPDLALMHLTAYDSLCHMYGAGSQKLKAAFAAMDENLGRLLAAAPGYQVILFSDHAQLPAEKPVCLNDLLVAQGFLEQNTEKQYVQSPHECYFECCGGCAFLHAGKLTDPQAAKLQAQVLDLPGVARLLHLEEMELSGHGDLPFGVAMLPGYAALPYPGEEVFNHGYPVDYPDYQVFYLLHRPGGEKAERRGGSLLDIAPLAAQILDLDMDFSLPAPKTI